MQPMWSLFLVGIAFFVILRIRNRKKRKPLKEVYARRIKGSQVTVYLNPKMSAACLGDHGIQFGNGFRRKEGPNLPHDGQCSCKIIPFSFTSNEVFNGALRREIPLEGSIPNFPSDQVLRLLERLRTIGADPFPNDEGAYIAAVGLENIAEKHHSAVSDFLRERYAYLLGHKSARITPTIEAQEADSEKAQEGQTDLPDQVPS